MLRVNYHLDTIEAEIGRLKTLGFETVQCPRCKNWTLRKERQDTICELCHEDKKLNTLHSNEGTDK